MITDLGMKGAEKREDSEGNARRFQCEACGCVWEADRSEYHRETDFRNGHYYVCKCPTCERDTISYPEDQQ